ncbi:MRG-domain-containing protein [Aulographum hederae CBS 113979]|uniref:Chromatin modification-related protein EAF3 n=1 Tax=Aulographum hederae CBS 113979 TaxID=1176131 RepID=A0A6G1HF81_9PEZI|nr:MRG-domain-containing protein [Aulographum hederae CBS 113979]
MAPGTMLYNKDEKVLCFHGMLMYEAKVIEVKQTKAEDNEYKVHYKGWKNTWDDWVGPDRMRKLNDDNRALAKQLREDYQARYMDMAPKTKKKVDQRSSRGSEEHSSIVGGSRKRTHRDPDMEKQETYAAKPSVRIHIHDNLKSILVDDWENVTKNLQVVDVPSETSAGSILDEYYNYQSQRADGSSPEVLEEVVSGMKNYFDLCLGRLLLYRFERPQYLIIHKKMNDPKDPFSSKKLHDLYGGEHLLRLFVQLPDLIAQTNMDQPNINRLREELLRMTAWLAQDENMVKYFSNQYKETDAEYQASSKAALPDEK